VANTPALSAGVLEVDLYRATINSLTAIVMKQIFIVLWCQPICGASIAEKVPPIAV
jgi:hypothetical protein